MASRIHKFSQYSVKKHTGLNTQWDLGGYAPYVIGRSYTFIAPCMIEGVAWGAIVLARTWEVALWRPGASGVGGGTKVASKQVVRDGGEPAEDIETLFDTPYEITPAMISEQYGTSRTTQWWVTLYDITGGGSAYPVDFSGTSEESMQDGYTVGLSAMPARGIYSAHVNENGYPGTTSDANGGYMPVAAIGYGLADETAGVAGVAGCNDELIIPTDPVVDGGFIINNARRLPSEFQTEAGCRTFVVPFSYNIPGRSIRQRDSAPSSSANSCVMPHTVVKTKREKEKQPLTGSKE